jgi:peptidoglycan/LPS O-acetylase OafA/YrhL
MLKNNFDLFRILLASIVVFYHVGILVGNDLFANLFPGDLAVHCFFVVSGFLITRSYLKNKELNSYFKARFLRVYPLYATVIIVCFVIGFFITNSDNYFSDGFRYLFFNFIFLNFLEPHLPGVFSANDNFGAVNGSLWTIKIEVMFYLSVPLIYGFFAKYITPVKLTMVTFFLSLACFYCLRYIIDTYGITPSINNQLPSMMCFFMVGAFINFIKLDKMYVLFFLPVTFYIHYNFEYYFLSPLVAGVIVYCFVFLLPKISINKKVGDVSYGIYIWHFPVIQFYISVGFFQNFTVGLILTIITVSILSYLSWHYIESKLVHRR